MRLSIRRGPLRRRCDERRRSYVFSVIPVITLVAPRRRGRPASGMHGTGRGGLRSTSWRPDRTPRCDRIARPPAVSDSCLRPSWVGIILYMVRYAVASHHRSYRGRAIRSRLPGGSRAAKHRPYRTGPAGVRPSSAIDAFLQCGCLRAPRKTDTHVRRRGREEMSRTNQKPYFVGAPLLQEPR